MSQALLEEVGACAGACISCTRLLHRSVAPESACGSVARYRRFVGPPRPCVCKAPSHNLRDATTSRSALETVVRTDRGAARRDAGQPARRGGDGLAGRAGRLVVEWSPGIGCDAV